jgi:L-amino acid N-acyltransferase YncA
VDREPVVVRAAEPGDADQLNEIYNHYLRTSHVTFDIPASIALHRHFGYEVGRFTEQCRKFGRYWNIRPLP